MLDAEATHAGRSGYVDFVAHPMTEESGANRRIHGDAASARASLGWADQGVGIHAVFIAERKCAAGSDHSIFYDRRFDRFGIGECTIQLSNAQLEKQLLLLRLDESGCIRFVSGVRQFTCRRYSPGELTPTRGLEPFQLCFEAIPSGRGNDLMRHDQLSSPCANWLRQRTPPQRAPAQEVGVREDIAHCMPARISFP